MPITPGPWIAEATPDYDVDGHAWAGRVCYTGRFLRIGIDDAAEFVNLANPANAHLVEAAPEMLEALKWAATVIRPGTDLRTAMDAAIAKAEDCT